MLVAPKMIPSRRRPASGPYWVSSSTSQHCADILQKLKPQIPKRDKTAQMIKRGIEGGAKPMMKTVANAFRMRQMT